MGHNSLFRINRAKLSKASKAVLFNAIMTMKIIQDDDKNDSGDNSHSFDNNMRIMRIILKGAPIQFHLKPNAEGTVYFSRHPKMKTL
jgi:hypothetical protein